VASVQAVFGAVAAAAIVLAAPGVAAKATVGQIASFGPRPAGSAAELKVDRLVAARLRALGYRVTTQTFSLPRGGGSRNVVARSEGPARILIGAHADGVRAGPGANDNGSGVAAMLELAAALRGMSGVLLVAFGAEERVETGSSFHLGSQAFLRANGNDRRTVRFAVSLDMVGVGARLYVRGLEASPNRSARLLLSSGRSTYLRDPTGQSDHAELTRDGLPAAWLQWREDRCWHSACDTASRVRADRLGIAITGTLVAARKALG